MEFEQFYSDLRNNELENFKVEMVFKEDSLWGKSLHVSYTQNGHQGYGWTINNRAEYQAFVEALAKINPEDFEY